MTKEMLLMELADSCIISFMLAAYNASPDMIIEGMSSEYYSKEYSFYLREIIENEQHELHMYVDNPKTQTLEDFIGRARYDGHQIYYQFV